MIHNMQQIIRSIDALCQFKPYEHPYGEPEAPTLTRELAQREYSLAQAVLLITHGVDYVNLLGSGETLPPPDGLIEEATYIVTWVDWNCMPQDCSFEYALGRALPNHTL